MFRQFLTPSAQSTPSQDVPEIEPFDEDEFETRFARLLNPNPDKEEDDEVDA